MLFDRDDVKLRLMCAECFEGGPQVLFIHLCPKSLFQDDLSVQTRTTNTPDERGHYYLQLERTKQDS